MLGQGSGVSAAANAASLSRQAVYRIQADPPGAEATLAMWSDLRAYPKWYCIVLLAYVVFLTSEYYYRFSFFRPLCRQ